MQHRDLIRTILGLAITTSAHFTAAAAETPAADRVQFNRDVRPILSEHCYACHGPDGNKREAELRLDQQPGLFEAAADGKLPIVPGKLEQSDLYRRITSTDPDVQMPPPKAGKKLSAGQIATIKNWIEQGAPWQGHWSYTPPTRPAPPTAPTDTQIKNDIDRFIRAALAVAKLRPAPEADRITLIRRLSLDLIGLPPTVAEVDALVADRSPDAYDKLVDRLLASPHYGERMAIYWLDLVRFADTIGYHSDNPRDITPYRDYVIAAFNDNKPFDQFTVEQLAGDLLPEATELQKTQWQKVASGYNRLNQTTEEGGAQAKEYIAKYAADRVRNVSTVWLGATVGCAECHDHKFDPYSTRDFYSLAAFFADVKEAAVGRREPGMLLADAAQEAELKRLDEAIAAARKPLDTPTPELASAQAEWEASLADKPAAKGKEPPKPIQAILAIESEKRSEAQQKQLAAHYRTVVAPLLDAARKELAAIEQQKTALVARIPKSLITVSDNPRMVRMLPRGNWLDDSGEVVQPGVPQFLAALNVTDRRANRLDLARWIVARDNPLPARVMVNRLWKLFFGQGLASLEDLGSQGAWPTHPELLDWLAVELMDSGWDVKHLVRLIVQSGTYRQSSTGDAASKQRDPYNKLLARQARFRLDAELVRDNALAVSGLLVTTIGGASVKPYQPDGYWEHLNFPKRTYQHDKGESQYRRGLYTHWQRSFLHPSLLAFDAPSREECVTERPRSNTPQQALVLLNDPTYVEASRVFAESVLKQGGSDDAQRLVWAWRRALSRPPQPAEVEVLRQLLTKHRQQYAADQAAAASAVKAGETAPPTDLDAAELAAWTSVARTILNLHETVTRQ